jgi:hypothetical protein
MSRYEVNYVDNSVNLCYTDTAWLAHLTSHPAASREASGGAFASARPFFLFPSNFSTQIYDFFNRYTKHN